MSEPITAAELAQWEAEAGEQWPWPMVLRLIGEVRALRWEKELWLIERGSLHREVNRLRDQVAGRGT